MDSRINAANSPLAADEVPTTLAAAFHEIACRHKDKIAVTDSRTQFTYEQLDKISAALARRLLTTGCGRGQRVGVLVDRSTRTAAAILGVLKCGAAYVPLDPTYPANHLRYIVDDAGLRNIVGSDDAVTACGLGNLRVIDPNIGVQDESGTMLPVDVSGSDPAYVIYTSGSTGRPKGCLVTHQNVLSLLNHTLPLFDFNTEDRWSIFHSHSFDFSVWELWGAILSGATAICVPQQIARSPEDFSLFLENERITVLNQVPSAFRALMRSGHISPDAIRFIRYVIFGGESVELDMVRGFLNRAADTAPTIVNMYGITEITIHATIKVLAEADLAGSVPSPIGTALPHLGIELFDRELQPVPEGDVGEMWVYGSGVAQGYLNRPALTAERFAYLDTAGGRVRAYRTGDLARRLPNGELEYLGRNDEQVKLRGFRIELPEIEAVLRRHPLVRDAAVGVVERGSTSRILTAFVVPTRKVTDRELTAELRRYTTVELPGHMVPNRYHGIDAVPLTPSGKTDRRALVEMLSADRRSQNSQQITSGP